MIAGVDEAGRGCLAGPVVAAAVILDPQLDKSLFKDSKLLSEHRRDVLFSLVNDSKSFIGLGIISNQEIDKINILNATMLAMKQSIVNLSQKPIKVIVDGNKSPEISKYEIESKIKGDQLIPEISAASIIAKVTRDNMMKDVALKYPGYEFEINKGYGTKAHYKALFEKGITPLHRLSFNLNQQETLF